MNGITRAKWLKGVLVLAIVFQLVANGFLWWTVYQSPQKTRLVTKPLEANRAKFFIRCSSSFFYQGDPEAGCVPNKECVVANETQCFECTPNAQTFVISVLDPRGHASQSLYFVHSPPSELTTSNMFDSRLYELHLSLVGKAVIVSAWPLREISGGTLSSVTVKLGESLDWVSDNVLDTMVVVISAFFLCVILVEILGSIIVCRWIDSNDRAGTRQIVFERTNLLETPTI